MKLNKYGVKKNGNFIELVKEEAKIYKDIDKKISSPEHIVEILKVIGLHERAEEEVYMLCLNTKLEVQGIFLISKGSLDSSIVHPREIFKRALLCNSSKIIIAHNHPSGDVTPSIADNDTTRRIEEGGDLLGIKLLDHVIVGKDKYGLNYYSYASEGKIN